jgi:SAM-dependent methyltransferase
MVTQSRVTPRGSLPTSDNSGPEMRILEIGCWKKPRVVGDNVVYLDKVRLDLPNFVLHDLETVPLPFPDNRFDEIYASHVLEHVRNLLPLMDELWRVIKANGVLKVWVPHWKSENAFTDPTHVRYFTPRTFYFFTENIWGLETKVWMIKKLEGWRALDSVSKPGRVIKWPWLRKVFYMFYLPREEWYNEIYVEMIPKKESSEKL